MSVPVISVQALGKAYRIWRDPGARLKGPIWDNLANAVPRFLRPRALRERLAHNGKSRYYRDFHALENISFEILAGEAVGIVGRNGSGKSTLLQIICGTLTPTEGSVRTRGRIAALLELGSGFNPDFTGRENVFLNGAVLGLSPAQMATRYDEIADFANIGDFIDQPTKTYSSGMIMRLAFAVQIAVEPDILIIDEALSVGDEAFQRKCFAHLQKLRTRGTTLLFVSHDAGTVVNLCNRAILLDQGRMVRIDTPKVVVTHYHQLIYAPDGAATQETAGNTVSAYNLPAGTQKALPELATEKVDESFSDPELRASDPLIYAHRGACIEKVTLLNHRGESVNHLSHGCRYRIAVDIRCDETCVGVFFGSMISTIKGAAVSGFNTPHRDSPMPFLESGQRICWTYDFTCLLFAGTYVVELGIGGRHGDDPLAFIHRVEDACLFKVLPSPDLAINGLVNLEQTGRIEQR